LAIAIADQQVLIFFLLRTRQTVLLRLDGFVWTSLHTGSKISLKANEGSCSALLCSGNGTVKIIQEVALFPKEISQPTLKSH